MSNELSVGGAAILFLAAAGGGALNAVVGGGSFLSFPALVVFGHVSELAANATSTVALWPGSIASAVGYRKHLRGARRLLVSFGVVSFVGGLVGSLLLIHTGDVAFAKLVPWLLLGATLIFTAGPSVAKRLRESAARKPAPAVAPTASSEAEKTEAEAHELRWLVPALVVQLLVAIYGGYFGGGMGILMLATLSAIGLEDLHFMNGVKNLLAAVVNGVSIAVFVGAGAIAWEPAFVMIAGAIAGGYLGALAATRTKPEHVRVVVTVVAWALTIAFFVRAARA